MAKLTNTIKEEKRKGTKMYGVRFILFRVLFPGIEYVNEMPPVYDCRLNVVYFFNFSLRITVTSKKSGDALVNFSNKFRHIVSLLTLQYHKFLFDNFITGKFFYIVNEESDLNFV